MQGGVCQPCAGSGNSSSELSCTTLSGGSIVANTRAASYRPVNIFLVASAQLVECKSLVF